LELIRQAELERFVLENSILFMQPEFVNKNIPSCFKVIFLAIINWEVFDNKKNKTFCTNLLRAIQFVLDVIIAGVNIITFQSRANDPNIIAYWINVMCRLLNTIKNEYPEIMKSCLESLMTRKLPQKVCTSLLFLISSAKK
jgi:hypothetical protein